MGVRTNRDSTVFGFHKPTLLVHIREFIADYNGEVDRFKRAERGTNIDDFVNYTSIKWSRDLKLDLQRGNYAVYVKNKIRESLYRPFCKQYLFFDRILNEEVYVFPSIFPDVRSELENAVICFSGVSHDVFYCLVSNRIVEMKFSNSANGGTQCFPFYVYDEDGGNRRENITDWALGEFRAAYGESVTKRDIFDYVYGLLHHPAYRERYAENLKRELPRLPLVPAEHFAAFVEAGRRLAELHLGYEQAREHRLTWIENKDIPFSWRVERMKLSADKTALTVNPSLTLAGIPPECFRYRLGNRSALEWVIDQYKVSTDKRSGIVSDPNRPDDEEYIARLVGRVITVSIETMQIIDALPGLEAPEA
ncbi:hypothetical protein K2Z83_19120 [Oscillochloris sp. ZM17-4]|uniref:type ISP restriction/modification enzyme n=1 Tax=Oscillochloris sp. ZM17-4 TaxID=2866714 RepID=UPI001C72E921|nr:hypothetical protein [Oscillochloris sp. ZM17-4]